MIKSLLSQLQSRQGVDPDPDHSDLVTLVFEDDITIGLSPAGPDSLTLYAHLGDLPVDATDVAEQLLAANLFWRDTEGATLSLEPYSRGVYLARAVSASQLPDVHTLEAMVNSFVELVARWRALLPGLSDTSANDQQPRAGVPGLSSLA